MVREKSDGDFEELKKPKQGYKLVKWYFGKEIEIPEEWELKKIKELSKVSVGLVINPSTYFDDDGTIPMITGKHVTENGIVLNDVDFITEKSNELLETTRIWSGDLVTMRVGYPGRTSVVRDEHNGINCASVIITRKSKKIVSDFFGHLSNSKLISKQIMMHQAGGAQQVVNVGSWKEFLIFSPPLSEQQKIAFILSSVDELINHYDRTINSTKKLKSGLMQTLLTNGIGHKKFKKTRLFPKYSDEKIPEDWNIDRIENLIKIIDYRGRTPPFSDQGIPHLRSNNIRHEKIILNDLTYVSKTTYDEYMTRGIPEKNDVLFTTEGPLGEVALVPENFIFSLAQRIIVLRSKSKKLHYGFLMYLLQDRKIKTRYEGLSTGTTLGGIASKWFTRLLLPFPESYDEQQKIASILSSVDDNINKLESKKDSLDKIKKGLMQKLLTGQIRVKI